LAVLTISYIPTMQTCHFKVINCVALSFSIKSARQIPNKRLGF